MINLKKIFNAGRVRRWHMNADMSWTDDFLDAHQGRVARILLALHDDPSRELLAAALTHDDGESESGDVCGEAKRRNNQLKAIHDDIEARCVMGMWGDHIQGWNPDGDVWFSFTDALTADDVAWLKFADKLDEFMWVQHKNPRLLVEDEWVEARSALMITAYTHLMIAPEKLRGVL